MLQIADAAMDHLEAFGGCARAKVRALDERCANAEQCSFARSCRAERAAADNEQVVLFLSQCRRISLHGRRENRKQRNSMHFRCRLISAHESSRAAP
jgi:hypothetical protein